MILPIVAYGDPVLRQECDEIDQDYPQLEDLISNMWETMDNANGVGLAAPQISLAIRLFVVDTRALFEDEKEGLKQVFINPIMLEEKGEKWTYEEGCLSIPGIRENVDRKPEILIEFYDEDWELKELKLDGENARVVQHEYDHIEGLLFVDYLSPLTKRRLQKRLAGISNGKVKPAYKMRFAKKR